MSRVRMAYVLAFFGILITTGGCAETVTAPEAATLNEAAISARKAPVSGDTTIVTSPETEATTMGGVILVGGEQRVSEP